MVSHNHNLNRLKTQKTFYLKRIKKKTINKNQAEFPKAWKLSNACLYNSSEKRNHGE